MISCASREQLSHKSAGATMPCVDALVRCAPLLRKSSFSSFNYAVLQVSACHSLDVVGAMSGGVCGGSGGAMSIPQSLHARLKRQLNVLGSPETPARQAGPSSALFRKLSASPSRNRASVKSSATSDVGHTFVGGAVKRYYLLEPSRAGT